jgi:hypothetical protein
VHERVLIVEKDALELCLSRSRILIVGLTGEFFGAEWERIVHKTGAIGVVVVLGAACFNRVSWEVLVTGGAYTSGFVEMSACALTTFPVERTRWFQDQLFRLDDVTKNGWMPGFLHTVSELLFGDPMERRHPRPVPSHVGGWLWRLILDSLQSPAVAENPNTCSHNVAEDLRHHSVWGLNFGDSDVGTSKGEALEVAAVAGEDIELALLE